MSVPETGEKEERLSKEGFNALSWNGAQFLLKGKFSGKGVLGAL